MRRMKYLPWKVFDTFDKSLLEGVAPHVVYDEVGGGVDDETEVVHAGQAKLPGGWPEVLLLLALTEEINVRKTGEKIILKICLPVLTHLAFFSTLRNSSKLRITRGMLLKRKTQTMHIRIVARFTFFER